MKDVLYLVIIGILTAAILTGLFFYNKGNIEQLSGTLPLNKDISLNFQQVTTKPAKSNRYYVIFYVNAANSSSSQSTLRVQSPINPCTRFQSNFYRSPSPSQTTFEQCKATSEYQQYLKDKEDYDQTFQRGGLELMTPQNQKCELNGSYRINNKYPNIGNNLTSYTFLPNEKKVGSIVFDCPEKSGKFLIKFRTSSLDLNI